MKFGLLSDPHIVWHKPVCRSDDVFETSLRKMGFVLKYCSKKFIPLLIAGDTTDSPRGWNAFPSIMSLFHKYRDVKVFAVYGQHDAYMRETRDGTILGILIRSGLVRLLDGEPKKYDGVYLYGSSWEDEVPKPKISKPKYKNVLVIHTPITVIDTPYQSLDAKTFVRNNGFDLTLCGDIHRAFMWGEDGKYIVNTGPMMRLKGTEEMFEHEPSFLVWDSEGEEFEAIDIPHERADKVLTRDHLDESKERDSILEEFLSGLKSGSITKYGKASKTFRVWADEQDIEKDVVDYVYKMLKIVEEERDG